MGITRSSTNYQTNHETNEHGLLLYHPQINDSTILVMLLVSTPPFNFSKPSCGKNNSKVELPLNYSLSFL